MAAIAILSSVVFFARESEDERVVPFVSELDGEEVPDPRMLSPEFSGVSGDGSSVNIVANVVTPLNGNTQILEADLIRGRINTIEGRIIDSVAPEGRVDTTANLAEFFGKVEVSTSDGFEFNTDGLISRIDRVEAKSEGPVFGLAPFGTLDAGAMEIVHHPDRGNVILFHNGVKLVYETTSQQGSSE